MELIRVAVDDKREIRVGYAGTTVSVEIRYTAMDGPQVMVAHFGPEQAEVIQSALRTATREIGRRKYGR